MCPSDRELVRKYGSLIGLGPDAIPNRVELLVLQTLDYGKADYVLKVLKAREPKDGR